MSFFVGQERVITQIALAAAVVCFVWLVVLQILYNRQRRAYRKLMRGQDGHDLERVLVGYARELDRIDETLCSLKATASDLDSRLCRCIQHVQMVRFNPFQDTVADQSFALALLNDVGGGAVVSTLHGRDLTRVYGKPINNKQSSYPLSPEEQQAIAMASPSRRRGRQASAQSAAPETDQA